MKIINCEIETAFWQNYCFLRIRIDLFARNISLSLTKLSFLSLQWFRWVSERVWTNSSFRRLLHGRQGNGQGVAAIGSRSKCQVTNRTVLPDLHNVGNLPLRDASIIAPLRYPAKFHPLISSWNHCTPTPSTPCNDSPKRSRDEISLSDRSGNAEIEMHIEMKQLNHVFADALVDIRRLTELVGSDRPGSWSGFSKLGETSTSRTAGGWLRCKYIHAF